jgi:hypothetical protein
MDESAGNVQIECEALERNHVRLRVTESGEETASLELPARQVVAVVSALLNAVTAAGKAAGVSTAPKEGQAMFEAPTIKPTGVGLMQGAQLNSASIVLQFGSARLSVRMSDKELVALGQALSALGTPRSWPQ